MINHIKQEIRNKTIQKRKQLSKEQVRMASDRICSTLIHKIEKFYLKEPKDLMIFAYIPKDNEVDIMPVLDWIWKEKERFQLAVPRVYSNKKDMDFYQIYSGQDLEPGGFGILEPKIYCRKIECKKAIVITPCVYVGKNGKRIGYGAGFYDRYFGKKIKNKDYIFLAPIYDFQYGVQIEGEEYDIVMDMVITEERECDIGKCDFFIK